MALWKAGLLLLAVLLVAGGVVAAVRAYRTIVLGPGFLAHLVCSGTFVSGRDPQAVVIDDLSHYGPISLFQWRLDRQSKTVTASLFGIGRRVAVFREGLGCTLAIGTTEAELRAQAGGVFLDPAPLDSHALWPEGERVDLDALPAGVDAARLGAAIDAAFAEPSPKPKHLRHTRAIVVVYRGRIVAERYAPGFDPHMPLLGWSMAKTALNALTGVMVRDGALKVSDKGLLPEWREDARRGISLDQLLRMTSGLDFDDDDNNERMLFTVGDIGAFAASKKLASPPGTTWAYTQGPSNIIALIMRKRFGGEKDYLRFPREQLFEPLGMRSAVLEPDSAGTFIGSTFMYASARDWARLGLLFLQDGVWRGRRLLPEGWVGYTTTPTRQSPGGRYGAHVWLRLPDSTNLGVPPMPEDACYMLGYDQQIVAMIPSRDLVIVRLGLTRKTKAFDHARELAPIVAAFPPSDGP
jgi:CubicO group peptidase (beta-lactamase class C family)